MQRVFKVRHSTGYVTYGRRLNELHFLLSATFSVSVISLQVS